MNKTTALFLVGAVLVVGVGAYVAFVPTISIPRPADDTDTGTNQVSYLQVPEGFEATYYTKEVPGARVMEFVPDGILVSQTKEGKVSLVTRKPGWEHARDRGAFWT